MAKVLINCLALIQSSGGYRSYCIHMLNRLLKLSSKSDNLQFFVLIHPSSLKYFDYQIPPENGIFVNSQYKGFKRSVWELYHLPGICKKYNIDIAFTPYQIGPVRLKNTRSILMFRNMEPYIADKYRYPLKNRIRSMIIRKLGNYFLKKSDHIIAVSDFTRSFLIEKIGLTSDKLDVVYHGIDKPEASIHGHIWEDYFFTAGSLHPYRRIEDVISAFDLFHKSTSSEVKLLIAGDGNDNLYKEKIRQRIQDSPNKTKIKVIGHVDRTEMNTLFSNALLFIMSSEVEACPNIALEAMLHGCCIVSSNNKPMPEFFKDAALYYNYRDSNELSQKLILATNDQKVRQELSIKAKKRSDHFSWDLTARNTIGVFEKVLKKQALNG